MSTMHEDDWVVRQLNEIYSNYVAAKEVGDSESGAEEFAIAITGLMKEMSADFTKQVTDLKLRVAELEIERDTAARYLLTGWSLDEEMIERELRPKGKRPK